MDASVVVESCLGGADISVLDRSLVAPPLMWPEARSAIRQAFWRGVITPDDALSARRALAAVPIVAREHADLGDEAWRIADELGWAKTYDAEYVGLAAILGCRLVTVDARLRRATNGLGFVVGPTEL